MANETIFQRAFAPLKQHLPASVHQPIRKLATAVLTPARFSLRSGHFRSSLLAKAVDASGAPVPWYTYPCIRFLEQRDVSAMTVLEFGGGQSTRWWAARAASVVCFEGDPGWLAEIQRGLPGNASAFHAPIHTEAACLAAVEAQLAALGDPSFDIVIVDGLWRSALAELAKRVVAPGGAIICDNAEGYGFYEAFAETDFQRVDFYGLVPGVVLEQATSIFWRDGCALFDSRHPFSTER